MRNPADSPDGGAPSDFGEFCAGLDDRVDEALSAMWRGESGPLDRLVDETHAPGMGVGGVLQQVMAAAPALPGGAPLPDHIGQYRIVRLLGEGGMGVVYEARQEHPRRTVALKVVRSVGVAGHASGDALRLFQREVQTLARLVHPNIAAIHDVGCTDEGRHFFAMELVRGVPLSRFVRERGLSTDDSLRLFHRVCIAIHYAHQHGVIHRDLKPSNILVDGEGNPKILDFGLAKITDADITVTTVATEVGKIQGTLPYMSPEQAGGDPAKISLLTDVYALGVMLYELLTRRLPYDVRRTLLPEALRVIREEPPRRPSTILRSLRGDLETIVLKALEKDPDRRYQSAAALAEDLERYLSNQPISARPPTTIYQLRKLIARHKAPSAFVAAVFLLILSFAAWMSVLYRQSDRLRLAALAAQQAEHAQRRLAETRLTEAQEAQRRARTAARTAETVNQFLQDMLAAADPEQGPARDVTIREVLDVAAHNIGTAFRDEPEVEMGVRAVLGTTYQSLGRSEDAEEQLRAALAVGQTLQAGPSAAAPWQQGRIMVALGDALIRNDGFAEAEELLVSGTEILARTLGAEHPETITGYVRLGVLRWKQDRRNEAETLLRDSVDKLRRISGDDHRDTAAASSILALILTDAGKLAEAGPLFRSVLAWSQKALGDAHPRTARAYNNLALNLQQSGEYVEAEALYRQGLESWLAAGLEDHPEAVLCRSNLGLVLNSQGRFAEAEPVFRDALKLDLRIGGKDHERTAGSYIGLGWALHELGRHDEADETLDKAEAVLQRLLGSPQTLISHCYEVRGRGLNLQSRFAEAESAIRKALDISVVHLGQDHPDSVRLYNELAYTLSNQEKYEAAEGLFRRALDAYIRTVGESHPGAMTAMHNVASVLERQGKPEQALGMYQKVVALAQAALPAGHWNTALFRGALGNCLRTLERYEEAEGHLLAAHHDLNAALGPNDRRTQLTRAKLVTLYEAWGKPDQAAQYGEQ